MKSRTALAIVLFAVYLVPTLALAAPVAFQGHYYEAVMMYPTVSWDMANSIAKTCKYVDPSGRKYDGHLAALTSAAENGFIAATFPQAAKPGGYWIGGLQAAGSAEPAGGWGWVTGEPFYYTNWAPGEPNNSGGKEDRIHLNNSLGQWNDLPKGNGLGGFIVEYTPQNRPPVAEAGGPYNATIRDVLANVEPDPLKVRGPDQFVTASLTGDGSVKATVTLYAVGSSDPDGDALTFTWTVRDGAGSTVATLTGFAPKVVLAPGDYTAQLVVRDASEQATDSATIHVALVDLAALAPAQITLKGPAAGDPAQGVSAQMQAGGALKVQFEKAALLPTLIPGGPNALVLGGAVTGAATIEVIDNALPVADAGGPYGAATRAVKADVDPDTLNVRSQGQFVTAVLSADAAAKVDVQLDGSGSSDPDGDEIAYDWTITDADGNLVAEAEGVQPTVALAPGQYGVALVVTDPSGESDSASATIDVTALNLAAVSATQITLCGPVAGTPAVGLRGDLRDGGSLMVKFERAALVPTVAPGGPNLLTFGGPVEGHDTINVIDPGQGQGGGSGKPK